uniref:Neurogenic locus notch-like protein 1 isoform X1 n=1 Tax=Tetranychus evansi TaxID=178897 RepID=A0A3G5APF2_9ACAR|nr:neurogenic locus notch-like protein 1 isoform X1 [Tetranychus evansi]
MFSKRLRFSILLTIITLFYQIVNLSSAQVTQVSTGWTGHDLNTYPPKINDESYLYYAGKTSDLNGLKIVVKNIPKMNDTEKLTEAVVTFDYWGYGGVPEPDNLATNFFSVGVSAYSEAKPDTQFAYFNDSEQGGNLGGNSWGTFEHSFNQPVYPVRIMITPNLASTEIDNSYYVALKGIQVIYQIQITETVNEIVYDAAKNSNVTKTDTLTSFRNVTLSCTSEDCSDFDLVNGATLYWSDKFFPTKPSTFNKFLTPDPGTTAPYQLTLTKDNGTDVCVKINYWLTQASNLTIKLDSSTSEIVLSPTYSQQLPVSTIGVISVADSMYDWYTIEVCMSHFMYEEANGEHKLSLIPRAADQTEFIAVGEIVETDVTTPALTQKTEMILESWTKSSVEPTKQWHYLPAIGELTPDKNSLEFSSVPNGNSIIYVYSDWFNLTTGLELRQTMQIDSCPDKLTVQLQLVDGNNNLVSTDSSDLCDTQDKKKSEKIFRLPQGELGKQHRLQFVIQWVQGSNTAKLSMSAVDLSDACRNDRATCTNHGTCHVDQPNVFRCECEDGYMREKCQKPDYCVLTFTENNATGTAIDINGKDYCTQRSGDCDPETFDPIMRKICSCGPNNYWKYSDTMGHSCAALDPCTGINVFCPIGYTCNIDDTNNTTGCTACDTANGYIANAASLCVKSSPCDSNPCINGAICKTNYKNEPVCYCENGVAYSTATGCDTDECSLDTRDELACSHTCKTTNGKSECSCLPGYELVVNTTTCEPTFNCTINCSNSMESICLLNADNTQYCSCLPGYVLINSTNECVDICTAAAENETQAMEQVKSICGSSTCSMVNSKLSCTCPAPYVNGPDGRCHIETACLPGGRGHTQCSSKGALCMPHLEASGTGQNLWGCICPIGTTEGPDNTCIDQCSIDEKSCLFDNAVCQKSFELGAKTHDCVCQPGLKKNETDGQCYLIEHSLRVEMVTRLDEQVAGLLTNKLEKDIKSFFMRAPAMTETCPYYAPLDIPGCVEYLTSTGENFYVMQKPTLMEKAIREQLISNLKEDLANVYGSTFDDINIINYSKLNAPESTSAAGDYKVIISLELTDPETENNLTPLNDEAVCHPLPDTISEAASYCVIPSNTVIQRASIKQTELLPCNETLIEYCPSNTQCKALDFSRFSCDCNPGFKAETIIKMDIVQRSNYYKEYCEDIDECSSTTNPCRAHSSCVNTIGSYMCPCNHEYIEDPKTGECISVCSTVTCVHGECIVITNNTGSCRCNEGYRGANCEEQDPMVKTFRTALITVAVVLGLLLIVVVLVAVILIKKNQKISYEKQC